MTDHAPFLAAICARPEDDLPRLLYADWLDETAGGMVFSCPCHRCRGSGSEWYCDAAGDMDDRECRDCNGTGEVRSSNGHAERAEFIRVQCELAKGEPCPAECYCDCCEPGFRCLPCLDMGRREDALRRRERELQTSGNVIKWLPSGFHLRARFLITDRPDIYYIEEAIGVTPRGECCNGPSPWAECEFRRGFVESITCSWSDFRTHADAIRKATPLRRVVLTDMIFAIQGWLGFVYDRDRKTWTHPDYQGIEFEMPQRAQYVDSTIVFPNINRRRDPIPEPTT